MALAPPPLPSLSLSDIMHPMSPPLREPPSSSPVVEILQDHEIARMRARALQMGVGTEETTETTPRERELFDMVLRLTNPNQVSLDASQLLRQAETISSLVHQRDYLNSQAEEERSRWESEKQSWERMSEALIVQRNRKVKGPDDSELRRMCQSLEYDNKALKEKLDRTQGRITAIEHELEKLKPNLLMQYFVPRHKSMVPPMAPSAAAPVPPSTQTEAEKAPDEAPPLPPATHPQSTCADASSSAPSQEAEATTSTDAPSLPEAPPALQQPSPPVPLHSPPPVLLLQPPSLHALAQASSYLSSLVYPSPHNIATAIHRRKKMTAHLKKALATASSTTPSDASASAPVFPTPPPSARTVRNTAQPLLHRKSGRSKSRRVPPQLTVSDARAEHLLIAARRIGRERAGIVAGVMSAERERMERERAEREKERAEREKERVEREKRNRGSGGYYRERPEGKGGTGDESRANRNGGGSSRAKAVVGSGSAAESSPKVDARGKGKGKGKSVPTPLDSLLTAARSMMDGGREENDAGAAAEPLSASTSSASTGMMTRRRAANANEQTEGSAPKRRRLSSNASRSPTRVRTALDVLADQAAVFSNSPGPGKGKGKGQAEELAASVVPLVKRKRGRPPKDRNKIVAAPVPVTASRLISPAPVAGPSQHIADADTAASASTSASANASQGTLTSRPATRWVQRGRLAASSSSRAPPRQKDDLESEDEDDEEDEDQPAAETVKVAEPEPALEPAPEPALLTEPTGGRENMDIVLRPTAVVAARPVLEEVTPAPPVVTNAPAQPPRSPPPAPLEDAVLDADADGESDPDVDMDGPTLL